MCNCRDKTAASLFIQGDSARWRLQPRRAHPRHVATDSGTPFFPRANYASQLLASACRATDRVIGYRSNEKPMVCGPLDASVAAAISPCSRAFNVIIAKSTRRSYTSERPPHRLLPCMLRRGYRMWKVEYPTMSFVAFIVVNDTSDIALSRSSHVRCSTKEPSWFSTGNWPRTKRKILPPLYATFDRCRPAWSFVENKRSRDVSLPRYRWLCAIPYSTLRLHPGSPESLNPFGSKDKPPYRASMSNDSDLKGSDAIEDAAKVRTRSPMRVFVNFLALCWLADADGVWPRDK